MKITCLQQNSFPLDLSYPKKKRQERKRKVVFALYSYPSFTSPPKIVDIRSDGEGYRKEEEEEEEKEKEEEEKEEEKGIEENEEQKEKKKIR
ncbi:hypothetical protein E2C01_081641 [Portunus trituberculatus]|uniref:Uncharacterized protein n=1 Tax=Portunus trituberculatus TaxID=210409 RepID=A0A5B7IWF1_PORTR|nr:hypothetical protein [Portunus trituberculatus]